MDEKTVSNTVQTSDVSSGGENDLESFLLDIDFDEMVDIIEFEGTMQKEIAAACLDVSQSFIIYRPFLFAEDDIDKKEIILRHFYMNSFLVCKILR